MAATARVEGDNVVIVLEYTAEQAKAQNIIDLFSQSFYQPVLVNEQWIEWSDLTNQDKLDILDRYIKAFVFNQCDIQRTKLARVDIDEAYPIDVIS